MWGGMAKAIQTAVGSAPLPQPLSMLKDLPHLFLRAPFGVAHAGGEEAEVPESAEEIARKKAVALLGLGER